MTECLTKVATVIGIILSDPAKSGLEDGAWIDGYDYQNKDKKHYHYEKEESVIFSVQSIIAKPMRFPTLLLLPSWVLQRLKRHQHSSKISQIHPLLKTIRKQLLTAILISG